MDRYCPIIPRANSWTPLTKKIIQASEGQPDVGSPKAMVFTIITIIIMKAIRQNINPIIAAMVRGAVVKATIPSMA